MASSVTTSIVVQFAQSAGSSGVLVVEVDDREVVAGGLNGGKTSFMPGDTVALLLYKSTNVALDAYLTSLGSLTPGVTVNVSKTEDIAFAGETEATVRYPVSGSFSYQWIGANMGTVSVIGENTLRIPAPAVGGYTCGLARVTYQTTAQVYMLAHSDPGFPEYGVVAFFAGRTA